MLTGEALHKHLDRIVPALIRSLGSTSDEETWQAAEGKVLRSQTTPFSSQPLPLSFTLVTLHSPPGVILSVQVEPGPATLIEELFKAARGQLPEDRAAAGGLLRTLCDRSPADLTEHIPQLMIFTAEALNDPSDEVCERAWYALEATIKVREVAISVL